MEDFIEAWRQVMSAKSSSRQWTKDQHIADYLYRAEAKGAVPNPVNLTKMRFCMAECQRDKWRVILRQAREVSFQWDGQAEYEITDFVACGDDLVPCRGLMGIADAYNVTSSEGCSKLEILTSEHKSERVATAIEEEVKHFCCCDAQVEIKSFRRIGTFNAGLFASLKQNVSSGCSDRAADAAKTGRLLKVKGFENISALSFDAVHELRTALKNPSRGNPQLLDLYKQIWGKRHAPGKSIKFSAKGRHRLHATQMNVIEVDGGQAAGHMSSTIRNFSWAPQRFDSEATPWESLVLTYKAFLQKVALDSEDSSDSRVREAATETLRRLNNETSLLIAMYADYHKQCNITVDALQTDALDPSTVPRLLKNLRNIGLKLFLRGGIFADGAGQTLTRIMLDQMGGEGIHFAFGKGEVTNIHWNPGAAGQRAATPGFALRALRCMQITVSLTNDLIGVNLLSETPDNYLQCFDLEAMATADSDRRQFYVQCYNKLVASRGWPTSPTEYCVWRDRAVGLWRSARNAATDAKINGQELCAKVLLAMEDKHSLPTLRRALCYFISFSRSTCRTERDINAVTVARNVAGGALTRQALRDIVTVRRYGPTDVEELCVRGVVTETGHFDLHPTPLMQSWQEKWRRVFGTQFNVRQRQRSDVGKSHRWRCRGTTRKAISMAATCAVASLCRGIDGRLDTSALSMFGEPMRDLQQGSKSCRAKWDQRFNEIHGKYVVWKRRNHRSVHIGETPAEKRARVIKESGRRQLARITRMPKLVADMGHIRIFFDDDVCHVDTPFMRVWSKYRADIIVACDMAAFGNFKDPSRIDALLPGALLAAALTGARLASMDFLKEMQNRVTAGVTLAGLPLSMKFNQVTTGKRLFVHGSMDFQRTTAFSGLQHAVTLHGSSWTLVMDPLQFAAHEHAGQPTLRIDDTLALHKFVRQNLRYDSRASTGKFQRRV